MSLRHQIEIMYLNYLDVDIQGIRLVRQVDGERARQPGEYNFRDTIEGFNSYLERSESPLDRGEVLDNISSLENLAKENNNQDLFREFVMVWDRFIKKIASLDLALPAEDEGGTNNQSEDDERLGKPWASNGAQVFKRAQAISGFGAAIGLLRDDDDAIAFRSLDIDGIIVGADEGEFMTTMNGSVENINKKAKRIGNAQRLFFRQFFKMLFWNESGCYLNLHKAQLEAYKSAVKIGI